MEVMEVILEHQVVVVEQELQVEMVDLLIIVMLDLEEMEQHQVLMEHQPQEQVVEEVVDGWTQLVQHQVEQVVVEQEQVLQVIQLVQEQLTLEAVEAVIV